MNSEKVVARYQESLDELERLSEDYKRYATELTRYMYLVALTREQINDTQVEIAECESELGVGIDRSSLPGD